MKYITLEELERRKKILQEKLDKTHNELLKESNDEISKLNDRNYCNELIYKISEIEYLIDYINMKVDDKKVEGQKTKVCVKCKHFIKCREYYKNTFILNFGDYCARFEEGNIEENRKWFDKYLEESSNISKERR